MVKPIAQQMTKEDCCSRLIKGLRATGSESVALNFSHLAHAVGMKKAESLVGNLVETQELRSAPMSSKLQMHKNGICTVDREAVLAACEEVHMNNNKKAIDDKTK